MKILKKAIITTLMLGTLSLTVPNVSGAATLSSVEKKQYSKVVKNYKTALKKNDSKTFAKYGLCDLCEPGCDVIKDTGYAYIDMNGDDVKELVIGSKEQFGTSGNAIYAIYTISNKKLKKVVFGGVRDRYYFCNDNIISNEGSSGAALNENSYYTLKNGKLKLKKALIMDEDKYYTCTKKLDEKNYKKISKSKYNELYKTYQDKYKGSTIEMKSFK